MVLLWLLYFFTALALCSCDCVPFLICFVVCVCVPVASLNVFFVFVVCVAFLCVCVVDCGGPVWADLWCVYYMWFWLRFGWLVGSGRLCVFDLVEFVYYNFIIIYCYLCYK